MNKVYAVLDAFLDAVAVGREYVARTRKFLVVAVPSVGMIVGTDAPGYAKAVAVLVALGVYAAPNAPRHINGPNFGATAIRRNRQTPMTAKSIELTKKNHTTKVSGSGDSRMPQAS